MTLLCNGEHQFVVASLVVDLFCVKYYCIRLLEGALLAENLGNWLTRPAIQEAVKDTIGLKDITRYWTV